MSETLAFPFLVILDCNTNIRQASAVMLCIPIVVSTLSTERIKEQSLTVFEPDQPFQGQTLRRRHFLFVLLRPVYQTNIGDQL